MESLRGWLLLFAFFVLSCVGVQYALTRLGEMQPEVPFQEMMYAPSGKALQIAAMGFDSPVADMLYLKGLIYYSSNARARAKRDRDAGHRFLAQTFNAAADLNPHFAGAYINGGLLLSSVGKTKLAAEIFDKGIERLGKAGMPDWRIFVHYGAMALVQMDDIELAIDLYGKAAQMEGVPREIIGAWHGLQLDAHDSDGKLGRLQRLDLELAQWQAALHDEASSTELRKYAEAEVARLRTLRVLAWMSDAYIAYKKEHGQFPPAPDGLIKQNFISEEQLAELNQFPFLPDERPVLLPNGKVRSMALARRWAEVLSRQVDFATQDFVEKHDASPADLEELVAKTSLPEVPVHPLAAVGYRFVYDPATGQLTSEPSLAP